MESSRQLPIEKIQPLFIIYQNEKIELKKPERNHVFKRGRSYYCFMDVNTRQIYPEEEGRNLSKTHIHVEETHVYTKTALVSKILNDRYIIIDSENSTEEISTDDARKVFHEGKKHFIFKDNKGQIYSQKDGERLSLENQDIKKIEVVGKKTLHMRNYYKDKYVIIRSNNATEKISTDDAQKVFHEGKEHFVFMDSKGQIHSQEKGKILSILNEDIKKIQVFKKTTFNSQNYYKDKYVIIHSDHSKEEISIDDAKKVFHEGKEHFIFKDNKGQVYSQEEGERLSIENKDIKKIKVIEKKTSDRRNNYKNKYVIIHSENSKEEISIDDTKKVFREGRDHFIFMDSEGQIYSQEEGLKLSMEYEDIKKLQVLTKEALYQQNKRKKHPTDENGIQKDSKRHSCQPDMELPLSKNTTVIAPSITDTTSANAGYRYYGFFEAAPQQSFEDIMKKKIHIIKR